MSEHTERGTGRGSSRPLSSLEKRVIGAILTDDCPGVRQLRTQLDAVRVVANWKPSGSPSIDLEVPLSVPAAPLDEQILPVNAYVYDEQENYLGELIIWLSEGRLTALEYAWVTDSMPPSLPSTEMLRVSLRKIGME